VFAELQRCVRERGPAPFVTWLSSAGRIELSTVTFANAVSKAGNFLVDGLELAEDSKINVTLGNHWQSPVWLATALSVGIELCDQGEILVAHSNAIQSWTGASEQLIVVSQDPFGMPEKNLPEGYLNGSAEVRNFGDYFAHTWENSGSVISFAGMNYSWVELAKVSELQRIERGIEPGNRVGLSGNFDLMQSVIYQVVMPVMSGISVVLIDQANPDISKIAEQEKIAKFVALA
jgi:uncharacterized protein (TIGR03089 family)